MADLLERVHGEIRARLRASEAAVREYERLEAALAALSGDLVATTTGPTRHRRQSTSRRDPASSPPARTTKRAPRGANRAAALRAIGEHPGAGVAELVAATGIGRGVLHALLGRLTGQGEIRKQLLPGDVTGYVLTSADSPVASTTEPDASASAGSATVTETPAPDADGTSNAAKTLTRTSPAASSADASTPSPRPDPVAGDAPHVGTQDRSHHRRGGQARINRRPKPGPAVPANGPDLEQLQPARGRAAAALRPGVQRARYDANGCAPGPDLRTAVSRHRPADVHVRRHRRHRAGDAVARTRLRRRSERLPPAATTATTRAPPPP